MPPKRKNNQKKRQAIKPTTHPNPATTPPGDHISNNNGPPNHTPSPTLPTNHGPPTNSTTPIQSAPLTHSIPSSPASAQPSDHRRTPTPTIQRPTINPPPQPAQSSANNPAPAIGNENDSTHQPIPSSVDQSQPQSSVIETVSGGPAPAPLNKRSVNLPSVKSTSIHSSNKSTSDYPTKPTHKDLHQPLRPLPELHHHGQTCSESTQDINDPTINPKSDPHKIYHLLNNRSNGIDPSIDIRPALPPRRPVDLILQSASNPSSYLSNGSSKPSEPSQPRENSPIDSQETSQNASGPPTKKSIKHVKFTNSKNVDDHDHPHSPSDHLPRRGLESQDDSDPKAKQNTIRREMSGATDQFDFDAQRRQHDGPGGGIVKKPRRRQPSEFGSGYNDGTTKTGSVHELGLQHARSCLRSVIIKTQYFAPQTDLEPNLVQIHLSYFDQNQDGILDPIDTWRAFRRLGFGFLLASCATLFLHTILSPFIGIGWWLFPDILGRCQLPIANHSLAPSRHSLQINPGGLSNSDDLPAHKIGPLGLWKKTRAHMGVAEMTDPFGWLKFIFAWSIAIGLTWPLDLSVKYELLNGVYNGELFFLLANHISTSTSKS